MPRVRRTHLTAPLVAPRGLQRAALALVSTLGAGCQAPLSPMSGVHLEGVPQRERNGNGGHDRGSAVHAVAPELCVAIDNDRDCLVDKDCLEQSRASFEPADGSWFVKQQTDRELAILGSSGVTRVPSAADGVQALASTDAELALVDLTLRDVSAGGGRCVGLGVGGNPSLMGSEVSGTISTGSLGGQGGGLEPDGDCSTVGSTQVGSSARAIRA